MGKYLDDRSRASDPGSLTLSLAKLKALEPELLTERRFKCGVTCNVDHPAAEMRERIAAQLQRGDSRAAVVVSLTPLVVAAYADDLDAVVLLRFAGELVAQYRLAVGSRLLAVNTFSEQRGAKTGAMLYAVDLVPGPQRSGWSNFTPFIAEFLSDDIARIEERKRQIGEPEWRTAAERAETRIARWGLGTARSGKPTQAGVPIRRDGAHYFQALQVSPEKKSWWKRLLES